MDNIINNYNVKIEDIDNTISKSLINHYVSQIYVINLATDKLRREYIKILMKKLNLNYKLITVNKPNINLHNQILSLTRNINKKMNVGEAGCYLSQMWCLKDIQNNNYKNAIIFEDDIIVHKNWNELFEKYVYNKDYDFLMLGAADHGFKLGNKLLIKDNIYIPKHHAVLGSHAIYYSQYGAQKMFEHRLNVPVYFDRNLKLVFQFFDEDKCGICSPNLFTVENSTSNIGHQFGITKYQFNDYYYKTCYSNFNFNDYYFVYLDLFSKACIMDINHYRDYDNNRFIKLLLMNYFNNDHKLCNYHLDKLDRSFFTVSEYVSIINSCANRFDKLFYKDYYTYCKKFNTTPGVIMKNMNHYNKYKNLYWHVVSLDINSDNPMNKHPYLFHKQLLNLRENKENKEIEYEIVKSYKLTKKLVAHLHCFNIDKFQDFYGAYLGKIREKMDIIITFSIGDKELSDISELDNNMCILKVDNYGYDIGAKFAVVNYLQSLKDSKGYEYDYMLFLHSKSDENTRNIYYNSLINNLDYIFERIEKSDVDVVGGFFPPTIHQGNNFPIIYDQKYLHAPDLQKCLYHESFNNKLYTNELLKYFGDNPGDDEKRITLWPSGNCYFLHRNIAEILFSDKLIYNCLNSLRDFDYNWVKLYYNIQHDNIKFIYECYKRFNLYGNNLKLRETEQKHGNPDMMVEHAFMRIVSQIIKQQKMKIKILPNEKNREEIINLSREIDKCY